MSASGPATADDFANWDASAKNMLNDTLRLAAKQCYDVARNMRGIDPIREGYYLDQAMTYESELIRRRKMLERHLGRTLELHEAK